MNELTPTQDNMALIHALQRAATGVVDNHSAILLESWACVEWVGDVCFTTVCGIARAKSQGLELPPILRESGW